jgi:hypothetical protein
MKRLARIIYYRYRFIKFESGTVIVGKQTLMKYIEKARDTNPIFWAKTALQTSLNVRIKPSSNAAGTEARL